MRKVCKVGMGCRSRSAIWLKLDDLTNRRVKPTSREVWGTMRSTNDGYMRLTSSGVVLDRSIYAFISVEFPPAFRQSRGKDNNVTLQCRHTAVVLIRSRSFAKNVAMWAKVSGGIRLTGARQFLMFFILLNIVGILAIASLI